MKVYKETTISDIALELKVSKSTVSRALNDHHSITVPIISPIVCPKNPPGPLVL
jgi:plasmid maintenance system antidote protein VapI